MRFIHMHRRFVRHLAACVLGPLLFLLPLPSTMWAQAPTSAVPRMVNFSGVLKDGSHRAITELAGVTFLIYPEQEGGAPLWLETQNVQPDATGRYTVQLGSASAHGLPAEVFTSGEGRWLAVRIGSEAEQPRLLLVAVPYAMKAADAETIGGLPPSAFVLAASQSSKSVATAGSVSTTATPPPNAAVTGLGTVNTVPLWDATNDIVSSAISQTGSGATAKIGINNAAPAVTLDVKGASTIRGALTMPTIGIATATAGKNSQPLNLSGSAFNSGTGTAANQTFRLETEPAGNNTASASGKLSLLYYAGANAAAETGLSIASNGQITFAAGQTFPGAGGGGISGVTAGTALTGGGTTGNVTLNLDTTRVPLLTAANIFTGNQTVNGNLTITSLMSASGFSVGGTLFAFGSPSSNNSFLGFAGNTTTTGSDNVGTGLQALAQVTSGFANTATGYQALDLTSIGANNTADGIQALGANTGGFYNSAVGALALNKNQSGDYNSALGLQALTSNTTGNYNTAIGYNAGPDPSHTNLTNSTAIGSFSQVTQSNSLVLGSINGVNGSNADTLVGIGTTAPAAKLDVHGTANFTGLVTFAAGQKFPGTGAGTITGVTAGNGLTGGGTTGGVTLNVDTTKVVTGVTAGNGLTGGGTGGVQALNLDTTKVPLLSNTNQFTSPNSFSSTGLGQPTLSVSNFGVGDGIDVSSASNAAISTTNSPYGVNAIGGNYPIIGTQGLYEGVYGDSYTDTFFAAAIVGMENGPTAATIGVFGEDYSGKGWGVYGQNQATPSNTFAGHGYPAGVWGDGGSNSDGSPGYGVGVNATADIGAAVYANNSSDQYPTIAGLNSDPNGYPFSVGNTTNDSGCSVDNNGNLGCTGSKNAVVKIDGGARRVALAAIESPKNWFEDFGSAQLVDGVAVVTLEPDFAQTVNTETDYKVFPVPNGDCKGLYVTHKTATSFEVRELGGGTSSVTFDYRITALRKNYENIRLADHSKDPVPSSMGPKRITNPGRFDSKKLIPPTVAARAASMHPRAERSAKP
jgi:hypothetical protein